MATHDGSKAKKKKDPEESCRRLLSAVKNKYNDECENYKDELTTDSEDCNVILRIEKTLSAPPDCDEPTDYNKLSKELQMVAKRINGRKYARKRDKLVNDLWSAINRISHAVSARPFRDGQIKITALQANNWLVNKLSEQKSVSIYEDPVQRCPDLENWIKKLEEDQGTERPLWQEFNPDRIEVFYFDPNQDGALETFVLNFSNRLCEHEQKLTFEHGKDSCRLLEYQRPDEQPPRWMLINLMKDVALVGLYLQIYELVEDESMRMIPHSHVLGFSPHYPSLLNFEKPATIPKGAYKQRLLEIILNKDSFSHGIEVLSSFDHNILEDPTLTDAQKQNIMKEVREALTRNAVVLAEVSHILDVFLAVNQNWKELRSSLTELLYQLMMHWNKLFEKVRNGADDSEFNISIVNLTYLRFRHEAIRVLNLVLNAKGPGAIEKRSTAPGDDGKGSEDSGSSGGDDEEHKTPGSSSGLSGPAKDNKSNMRGSGPLDSSDENLGGSHDGGKQKVHDCRLETTETSKVQMAFLTGLIVGRHWVQPMISQRMKSFVITKRGLQHTIISRRSVQALLPDPLESAHRTGLGQVLSLIPDSSTSSSGPVASSSENMLRGYEELPVLPRTSPHRPDLGEVKGLFASETTPTGSSLEEHMTNKFIPSRPNIHLLPIPTGQTV